MQEHLNHRFKLQVEQGHLVVDLPVILQQDHLCFLDAKAVHRFC